jgi:hypothetical protein
MKSFTVLLLVLLLLLMKCCVLRSKKGAGTSLAKIETGVLFVCFSERVSASKAYPTHASMWLKSVEPM